MGISKAPGEGRHLVRAVLAKVACIWFHNLESHFDSFRLIIGSILRQFRHLGWPRDFNICVILRTFRYLGGLGTPSGPKWLTGRPKKAKSPKSYDAGESIWETFCTLLAFIFLRYFLMLS